MYKRNRLLGLLMGFAVSLGVSVGVPSAAVAATPAQCNAAHTFVTQVCWNGYFCHLVVDWYLENC